MVIITRAVIGLAAPVPLPTANPTLTRSIQTFVKGPASLATMMAQA